MDPGELAVGVERVVALQPHGTPAERAMFRIKPGARGIADE